VEQAWNSDPDAYLGRALPLSRRCWWARHRCGSGTQCGLALLPVQLTMLARCAELLEARADERDEVQAELLQYRELAAYGGDRQASWRWGCGLRAWMAKGGVRRTALLPPTSSAIRWLTLAGEQGWPKRGLPCRASI
jgi:hypothetical protein